MERAIPTGGGARTALRRPGLESMLRAERQSFSAALSLFNRKTKTPNGKERCEQEDANKKIRGHANKKIRGLRTAGPKLCEKQLRLEWKLLRSTPPRFESA
eukprot:1384716-Rhodomonas_salina.1